MSKLIDVEEFKQELSKASVWTTLSISEIVDSIAFDAIGCADRQVQDTLNLVGKVNTEL